MPEGEFALTFTAPRKADVAGLVDRARRMAETWGQTVVIASPTGYAYRVFRPSKKRNPPRRLIAVEAQKAQVPELRDQARRLAQKWGKPVALVSKGGRILAVERPNPAAAPLGTGERFRACVRAVRARGSARDPEAVCAAAGRKKYGARQMAAWAAAGRHNPQERTRYLVVLRGRDGSEIEAFSRWFGSKDAANRYIRDLQAHGMLWGRYAEIIHDGEVLRTVDPETGEGFRRRKRENQGKSNPARSAAQYGAAQAVLSGASRVMPERVARELVDATPPALRRKFARELARRRRRTNPEDAELESAAQLWRQFHGSEPHGTTTTTERRVEPATLADLGRLVELTVRVRPGETALLRFGPSVRLAATPDGGQLYVLGGDQRLDLRKLGLADTLPKDHVLVGDVLTVTYATEKRYDGSEPTDYIHRFGEDGGERPVLAYDTRSKRLYLVGGTYKVRKEGVTN